jgi:amidophosphoribosyltransferase
MCGIVGIFNESRPAGSDIFVASMAQQHRGRESVGIATYDETSKTTDYHVGMGDVLQVFADEKGRNLRGMIGIGHVRYSNTGSSSLQNSQPVCGDFHGVGDEFMLGHNGQIVNLNEIRGILKRNNCAPPDYDVWEDCSDTRLVADLISCSGQVRFEDALVETFKILQGAFCFVVLYHDKIYAARDRHGVHPLQIGRRDNDYFVSSESCAFSHLEVEDDERVRTARFVRDIKPGEMIVIDKQGVHSYMWAQSGELKFDIFELIYFLRPDSNVHGVDVFQARRRMGEYLAMEHPTQGLIIPIERSGKHHGRGYYLKLKELGLDVEYDSDAIVRSDVGRVWMLPNEDERLKYLRTKFNVIEKLVANKELTLVDDSIVRGLTIKHIVSLCRRAGARKVHVRSGSDQYLWPDIYGNDTYKDYLDNRLIARRLNGDVRKIAEEIGADSVGYLSLENTKRAILDVAEPGSPFTMDSFHDAVFSGEYALGTGDYVIK